MNTRFILLTTVLALPLAGCGDETREKAKEVGRTIGEAAGATWNSVRELAAEKKDQAMDFFSKSKDVLAKQYAASQAKGEELAEDAGAALKEKWAQVETAYAKAKDASGEGWATARDAFIEAYRAFEAELKKRGS